MTKYNWSWFEMCGPAGLEPWIFTKHDIGTCFQQIFLQIPVLVLFAIVSAYYYGSRTEGRSVYQRQKCVIYFRLIVTLLIAIIPVARIIVGVQYAYEMFRPVDYLTGGIEIIAWFVHAGYVLSLRHEKNYNGPVVVRVLWTLLCVLSVISFRTQTFQSHAEEDVVYKVQLGFCIGTVISNILYGLSFFLCVGSEQSNLTLLRGNSQLSERSHLLSPSVYHGFMEVMDPEYLGVAMDQENWLSRLTFSWVSPLMNKGCNKKLETCDDLYDLPSNLSTSYLCAKLHSALNSGKKPEGESTYGSTDVTVLPKMERVTLLKGLHICFGAEFYSIGIMKFLSDVSFFGCPLLLNKLITYIESRTEPVGTGCWCVFGLFMTTLIGSLLLLHFNFCMENVILKIRGALIGTIYRKTLNTSYESINKFSIGEIANFMNTDVARIVNSCPSFHSSWSVPLQIIITIYLLYEQVGLAFLAGVFFTVVLIPINKYITKKIGELSTKMMEQKDQRVAAVTELLRGIRVLKIHVWEDHFLEKILRIRGAEVKHLKGRKYLDAICVYFWATTPMLISVFTFATYALMGCKLTAAKVFTTMALLNMLISPLNAFPWILNGLTEAWVSLKRIQKLLDCDDNNFREYFEENLSNKYVYSLKNCFFRWGTTEGCSETQTGDNDEVHQSNKEESSSSEQNTLLVNETENKTVYEIENRSRSNNCFSLNNVNLVIGEGDFVGVIGPVGSGKSTLLAGLTGDIQKIKGTISMKNIDGGCALVNQTPWIQRGTFRENVLFGKSFDSSWYKTVLEACCLTQDLETFSGGDSVNVGEGGMSLSGGQRARLALARAVYQNKDIYLMDDILASVDVQVARHIYNKVICGLLRDKTRVLCTNQPQFLTKADLIIKLDAGNVVAVGKPAEILTDFDEFNNFEIESPTSDKESWEPKKVVGKIVLDGDEEKSETGAIKTKVVKKYWTSVGHFLAVMILISVVLMQTSRNVTDYWLALWVAREAPSNSSRYHFHQWSHPDTEYYLSIYGALSVMNTFIALLRAFLFAYGGLHAAIVIHEKLLRKVLSAKITFFDISPVGRILNRLSSDTYTIDDSLPFITNIFFAQFIALVGSCVMTTLGLPWLYFLFTPLVPIYNHVQHKYRCTSRELKRLGSITLSPVYCHISETLQGLTTIRAFRSLSRFRRINEEYLESNQKSIFASRAAQQWLSFRLQMMGVIVVTGVSVVAVLKHEFDIVSSAVVGLAVSYSFSITSLLNGVVSSFTETEQEMISLERVGQYIDEIESEPESGNNPPYAWLSQGVIVFQGVYLKYREHIPPSLNGISFETRPAEKIGVVGRTGAGKSSLIVALLRLVNLTSGKILIDAVNINQISLQALRSRISVIPQDPFLFEGSVRDNVDPLGEYSDSEIWSALHKCHIKDLIEMLGGLSAKVFSGGRNFSQGQKQLLCLVRAVLRNAKIVCVDEATAFVDSESDKKIQYTIRSSFRQSTVLTIAHRISTIMDCDRILVLNDGEVVEFDSPKTLALDETSYFYQLCQHEIQ